jgi:hypothetical protein
MVFSDANNIQTHLVGVGDLVQQVTDTLGGIALFAGHGVWGRRDKIVQTDLHGVIMPGTLVVSKAGW